MLYVAGEILIWMVLAGLLGLGLGWFIWGYRSKGEAERRDREVAAAGRRRPAGAAIAGRAQLQELLACAPGTPRSSPGCRRSPRRPTRPAPADAAEAAHLRLQVADLQAQLGGLAGEERAEAEERAGAAEDILEDHDGWEPVGEIPGMEEAQEQLGRPVIIDDLKVVEGIGPQVEEVLQSAGITSWAALANSTPESLTDRARAVPVPSSTPTTRPPGPSRQCWPSAVTGMHCANSRTRGGAARARTHRRQRVDALKRAVRSVTQYQQERAARTTAT